MKDTDVELVWLSEAKAVKYTSLSRKTLFSAREAGKITYRIMGRRILYKKSDLDAFIERNSDLIKSVEDRINDIKTKKTKIK